MSILWRHTRVVGERSNDKAPFSSVSEGKSEKRLTCTGLFHFLANWSHDVEFHLHRNGILDPSSGLPQRLSHQSW